MQPGRQTPDRAGLLDAIPIKGILHFGRPLAVHMLGTHDLLSRWGNPDHVCLAGLFHSVYGTKTFTQAALTESSRDDVRALIGEEAESLVYIFGMSDRRKLMLENPSSPYAWEDHRTGERSGLGADVLDGLVEMEVANFIEQLPFLTDTHGAVIEDMRRRFDAMELRMSAGAGAAYHRALDGYAGPGSAGALPGA